MAWTKIPGKGMLIPRPTYNATAFGYIANVAMTTSGMKVAFIGRLFWSENVTTKNLQSIAFRFGTVVKTSGSTMRVSLQNVSTSTGPPGQPTGTVLQSYTIANSDANFVTNTWYPHTSGVLGSVQSVSLGQLSAVVFEYVSFFGSDSVTIDNLVS